MLPVSKLVVFHPSSGEYFWSLLPVCRDETASFTIVTSATSKHSWSTHSLDVLFEFFFAFFLVIPPCQVGACLLPFWTTNQEIWEVSLSLENSILRKDFCWIQMNDYEFIRLAGLSGPQLPPAHY